MARISIDILDDIHPAIAVDAVSLVVKHGKISKGENGKMYYCWATLLESPQGRIVVETRQYRKSDCFVVYKEKK